MDVAITQDQAPVFRFPGPQLTFEASRALADRIGRFQTFGQFIGGEWVEGCAGRHITLSNPATRAPLADIAAGNAADVDRAVSAASTAFPAWSRAAPGERQKLLLAMAERLRARLLDYAMMETLNNGKTISEAMMDVVKSIELLEYFAGAPFYLHGELSDFEDAAVFVHREPIGVVAQIIPWNVALFMATMKLAPALAAGCTVVLKPAETVCLSVLEFIRDIADLLPPGVVNVVTGYGADVGEALVSHPKVRKVAFTGSRETARKILHYASVNLIPQTLELGGKSANIVCEDADLDAAAESVVMTMISNKGEVCYAGTRIFVHRTVRDAFLTRLRDRLGQVRQGDPVDPASQIGAQSSQTQFDRVMAYIALGREEGAEVSHGGERARIDGLDDGLFIQPTLFAGMRNDMRIAQEEIFGPVAGVIDWDDEADLIAQVNNSIYGLGGGLWTNDLTRAHRLSRAIETGTIWVNRYYNFKPGMPIGGYKQSGFGREHTFATLDHYTQTKAVVVALNPGEMGFFRPR